MTEKSTVVTGFKSDLGGETRRTRPRVHVSREREGGVRKPSQVSDDLTPTQSKCDSMGTAWGTVGWGRRELIFAKVEFDLFLKRDVGCLEEAGAVTPACGPAARRRSARAVKEEAARGTARPQRGEGRQQSLEKPPPKARARRLPGTPEGTARDRQGPEWGVPGKHPAVRRGGRPSSWAPAVLSSSTSSRSGNPSF